MTSRDLVMLMLRRWYVLVVGGLLALGVTYQATHQAPLFFTQYSIVLLPPQTEVFPNSMEDPHYGLSQMAGLVVSDYNNGERGTLIGSADTTLFGEGLRSGSRVRLPNFGSQWQPIYDKPNIDVQILGASQADVNKQAQEINDRVLSLLKKRQDGLGIVSTMRIGALVSPQGPVVTQVGGSRARGLLGIALVSVIVSMFAAVQFDRWRRRRPTSRQARRGTPAGRAVSLSDTAQPRVRSVRSSAGERDQPRSADALQPANSGR